MLIVLILVLISIIAAILFHIKTPLYNITVVFWTGVFLMLFTAILLISKFGNYPQFIPMDYFFYKMILNIKLLPTEILRIHNVGYAFIMTASFLVTLHIIGRNKKGIILSIVSILMIAAFLVLNDPSFKYNYYIFINFQVTPTKKTILSNFEYIFKIVCISIVYLFAAMPCFALLSTAKTTMLRTMRNFYLEHTVIIIMFYMYIAVFFTFGAFKPFSPTSLELLSIPRVDISAKTYTHMILTGFILTIAVNVLIFMSNPFKKVYFFSRKDIDNQSHFFNKNINILIHADKNSFVIIKKLALKAQDNIKNPSEAQKLLNDIISASTRSVEQLSDIASALNNNAVTLSSVNLYTCLHNAINKTNISDNITLITNFEQYNSKIIQANEQLLTEAFFNIIDNAVYSLGICDKQTSKVLKILVEEHNGILYIEFEDNGTGISRLTKKNIFKEFYSTKNSTKNLGLGLSAVKKIIEFHLGEIRVESIPNKYTCFCIKLLSKGEQI